MDDCHLNKWPYVLPARATTPLRPPACPWPTPACAREPAGKAALICNPHCTSAGSADQMSQALLGAGTTRL